jgi:hypothetical protein
MTFRSQPLVNAQPTLTVGFLPSMCIGIQEYVRNDFKGVLFVYIRVKFEPYGTEQIMLLCHNSF